MTFSVKRRQLIKAIVATGAIVGTTNIASIALAAAKTHKVKIQGFAFSPNTLKVKVGDKIIWENMDGAPHTATSDDNSWTTKTLNKGNSESIVVTKKMATSYHCAIHPNMKAKLIIK